MSGIFKKLVRTITLLLPFAAVACFAQFSSGVQGNVLDPSGAAIPNATVTLTNVETHVAQTATSDSAGVYRFVSLAPGNYTVSAKAKGFSASSTGFVLQTAENRNVQLTLAVGNVATSVTVTTQAPLLDTSDTRNQYTLSTQAIQALPLANRNPDALLGVTPGVTGALDVQGNLVFAPENFLDASANGRGENGNTYVVDGLDVTSNVRPGVINLSPGEDAVQELSVQTNVYNVDYGRGGGIQTLVTTKSGTQRFHGDASEYYTYQGFAARGEFGPSYKSVPHTPPYHTNNMSFALGGPILPKQKLFFFATFQPYHNEGSSYSNIYYEDPAFVAFAQKTQPGSPEVQLFTKYPVGNAVFLNVNQTAAQAFGPSDPAGNSGCATPSTDNIPCATPVFDQGTYNRAGYTHAKQYSVRIDKYFSKDRLYGNFIRDTDSTLGSNPRQAFVTTSNLYGFALQGNETHTFSPNTLNEAIFAYNKIEGIQPQTGLFSVPVVNVGGLGSGFGAGFAQGDYVQHSYHWRDVLTHIKGSHSLSFGYEGWHGDDTAHFQGPYGQPTFSFNNIIDLINNNPYTEGGLSYNVKTGKPEPGNYGYSETTAGIFAQDSWKATKNLTVNYGIRYDNFGNPYPTLPGTIAAPFILGQGSTLNEQVANGAIRVQSHTLNHDMNWNFSPRVGAAWDVFGSGQWVLRSGFGVYRDQITLGNIGDAMKGNPPNWVTPTFFNDGSTAAPIFGYGTQNTYPFGFPYPAFQPKPLDAKGGIVGSQVNISNVAVNVKTPITYVWSVTVEHPLTRDLVASAYYVGSHSNNVLMGGGDQAANQFGYDLNRYAGDLIQHAKCDSSGRCKGVTTRLNTSFGAINYAYNVARANYSGLVLAIKGRVAQRAFITASYTRSASKDDESIFAPGFNQNRFYGNSPYDYPNRFSLAGSYDLAGLHDGHGWLGRATGGWQLAGTVTLQSGSPIFVNTGAPFDAQLINPALPPSASNLKYRPDSGDFDANGYNYDLPNVDPHAHIKTSRSAYMSGVFPNCVATNGSNFNGCGPFSFPTFGGQGNEAVNAQFRNPGFAETDATLKKTTTIKGDFNLELRLDAFNAFNRVNLNGIDGNAYDGNWGKSTSTHTARYLQVGATLRF